MKIRSFLAFDLSDEVKGELKSLIALLEPKSKEVRWVQPERVHGTVRFFGDVEEELLLGKLSEVIARELRHQAPMHLVGRGLGVFPNWRYPKVLWAGLAGDTDAMRSLHRRLEEAFGEFGFAPDDREFRLHLTIGRAKKARFKGREALMQMVEKMADREFGEIAVDALVLYRSELTPDGPIYTPLKRFSLGGRDA